MAAQSTHDRAFRTSAFVAAFIPQVDNSFYLILGGLTGAGRPYLRLYDHTWNKPIHELVLKSGLKESEAQEQVTRLIQRTDQPNASCWVRATMLSLSFEDTRKTRGNYRATYYRYSKRRSELLATTITGDGEQPMVICTTSYAFNPTRNLESTHRGSQVYKSHRLAYQEIVAVSAKKHTICPKAYAHDIERQFAPKSPKPRPTVLLHGGDGPLAF